VQVAAQHVELEELAQDAMRFVVGASGAGAPLELEELLEPLSADWRLEVGDFEVGEVARQFVEDRFVIAIRRFGQPLSFCP
jgi:hypothetical protein